MKEFQKRALRLAHSRDTLPVRTGPKMLDREVWDALSDDDARYEAYVQMCVALSQSMGRELLGAAFGEICHDRLPRLQFQSLVDAAQRRAAKMLEKIKGATPP